MPAPIQALDETVLRFIAEHLRAPLLDAFFCFYTTLGNSGLLFIAAALVMVCFARTRRAGASAGVGMALGFLVTNVTLKHLVGRARPWVVMEGFTALVAEGDPNSFPSGHSCSAFAFAVAAAVVLPQKWAKAAALIAAALMALSRVYVGVHFPSDVLVGAGVGALCGAAGAWIVQKVTDRYRARRGRE